LLQLQHEQDVIRFSLQWPPQNSSLIRGFG
jgi:hypothetical protein